MYQKQISRKETEKLGWMHERAFSLLWKKINLADNEEFMNIFISYFYTSWWCHKSYFFVKELAMTKRQSKEKHFCDHPIRNKLMAIPKISDTGGRFDTEVEAQTCSFMRYWQDLRCTNTIHDEALSIVVNNFLTLWLRQINDDSSHSHNKFKMIKFSLGKRKP